MKKKEKENEYKFKFLLLLIHPLIKQNKRLKDNLSISQQHGSFNTYNPPITSSRILVICPCGKLKIT